MGEPVSLGADFERAPHKCTQVQNVSYIIDCCEGHVHVHVQYNTLCSMAVNGQDYNSRDNEQHSGFDIHAHMSFVVYMQLTLCASTGGIITVVVFCVCLSVTTLSARVVTTAVQA